MSKKSVLIAVGNDYPHRQEAFTVSPPLGILAVGSYLAANDIPVELIDVQMDFGFGLTVDTERRVCQRVARYLQGQIEDIAWIGISQLSNSAIGGILAQEIHTALPETPLVLGGYSSSANYRFLLQEFPFVTAIVRGDGEAAALQISRSLAQGTSFLSEKTPNLAWLDEERQIHTSPVRSMPLDDLPILDFRLLHNPHCYQFVQIITTRGCPFHCDYCLESGMRPFATYPTSWVSQQLEHLETMFPPMRIGFSDPIFGVSHKRTLEVCQILHKHHFTYGCESRVDVLAPDLVPFLHEAGVEAILLGIESASLSTLVRMQKVNSEMQAKKYLQSALKLLRACFKSRMLPFLALMLGFPDDTEADLQATLDFVKEVRQLHDQVASEVGVETGLVVSCHRTKVYAGSPLADHIQEKFPHVVLSPGDSQGEWEIASPSPELSIDVVRRYKTKIAGYSNYTAPQVAELLRSNYAFEPREFVSGHPELTDGEGVTVLSKEIRNLSI